TRDRWNNRKCLGSGHGLLGQRRLVCRSSRRTDLMAATTRKERASRRKGVRWHPRRRPLRPLLARAASGADRKLPVWPRNECDVGGLAAGRACRVSYRRNRLWRIVAFFGLGAAGCGFGLSRLRRLISTDGIAISGGLSFALANAAAA